jgi:hypothetical protein
MRPCTQIKSLLRMNPNTLDYLYFESMSVLLLKRREIWIVFVLIIIIIVGIQPLGRSGQKPELSQATGMVVVRCILVKFLGVVCHCFPPRLDVPTFATRCPHVRHDARDPSFVFVSTNN